MGSQDSQQVNGHGLPPGGSPQLRAAAEDLMVAQMRAAASALVARSRLAQRAGLTFGGDRNLDEALGYETNLTLDHYAWRYRRGGIAKTIIELAPRACWASGAEVFNDPDAEVETAFERETEALFKRLSAWDRMLRADILAGLGEYSVLLIGGPVRQGAVDGGGLAEELPRGSGRQDAIAYLHALPQSRAKIEKTDEDPSSPRFGLPVTYQITIGTRQSGILGGFGRVDRGEGGNSGAVGKTVTVHWTRVVHVAEGLLEDDVYGPPRLEAVWNYLNDLDKVRGGGAEAAWVRAHPGMNLAADPEKVDVTSEEGKKALAALADKADEYLHGYRRMLETVGVDVKMLDVQVANFGPNVAALLDLISAVCRIPQRILTGSERGEQASTQDRSNWADTIAARRDGFCTGVVRALVDRLVEFNYLPKPGADGYEVSWPEIDELTEDEKAGVALKHAQANQANVAAGGGLITTQNEIRDLVHGLGEIEEVISEVVEPPGGDEGEEGEEGELAGEEDEESEGGGGLRAAAERPGTHGSSPHPIAAAADRHVPRLRRALNRAFRAAAADLPLGELEEALRGGNRPRAEQLAAEAIGRLGDRLDAELPATLIEGAALGPPDAGGGA